MREGGEGKPSSDEGEAGIPDDDGTAGAWAETLRAFAARDRLSRQLEAARGAASGVMAAVAEVAAEMQSLAEELEKPGRPDQITAAETGRKGGAENEESEQLKGEISKLKKELAVAKKRFEKEEKLAAERGADIEDLREQLLAMQQAASCFENETSAAGQREKSMREDLNAKDAEIASLQASLQEALTGQAESTEQDAAPAACDPLSAAHQTAFDRIYSILCGDEAPAGAAQSGGIQSSETKSSGGAVDLEISVQLDVSDEDEVSVGVDVGDVKKALDDTEASLEARADRLCEKARLMQDQLRHEQDGADVLRGDVERLRESLAKAEGDAARAKGEAQRLEKKVAELKLAAEADAETEAPRGVCSCMG